MAREGPETGAGGAFRGRTTVSSPSAGMGRLPPSGLRLGALGLLHGSPDLLVALGLLRLLGGAAATPRGRRSGEPVEARQRSVDPLPVLGQVALEDGLAGTGGDHEEDLKSLLHGDALLAVHDQIASALTVESGVLLQLALREAAIVEGAGPAGLEPLDDLVTGGDDQGDLDVDIGQRLLRLAQGPGEVTAVGRVLHRVELRVDDLQHPPPEGQEVLVIADRLAAVLQLEGEGDGSEELDRRCDLTGVARQLLVGTRERLVEDPPEGLALGARDSSVVGADVRLDRREAVVLEAVLHGLPELDDRVGELRDGLLVGAHNRKPLSGYHYTKTTMVPAVWTVSNNGDGDKIYDIRPSKTARIAGTRSPLKTFQTFCQ